MKSVLPKQPLLECTEEERIIFLLPQLVSCQYRLTKQQLDQSPLVAELTERTLMDRWEHMCRFWDYFLDASKQFNTAALLSRWGIFIVPNPLKVRYAALGDQHVILSTKSPVHTVTSDPQSSKWQSDCRYLVPSTPKPMYIFFLYHSGAAENFAKNLNEDFGKKVHSYNMLYACKGNYCISDLQDKPEKWIEKLSDIAAKSEEIRKHDIVPAVLCITDFETHNIYTEIQRFCFLHGLAEQVCIVPTLQRVKFPIMASNLMMALQCKTGGIALNLTW